MPDRHLFLQIATASQYVGQVIDRELEAIGLPAYLLALLTHVRDHAPVTPSKISAASGVPMTTLRDNIQRLVDGGLALRIPHPTDGRSYRLQLTARGEQMTRVADPMLAECYAAVERLLPKPLADYQAAVQELNAALEQALAELEERDR